jgi:cysteinyl-tRNA synthetase
LYADISSQSKKYIINKIQEETGVTHSYQNLNNKIYKLIKKGYLWKDEDSQVYFKPFILKALGKLEKALEEGKHYDFTFRFQNDF